MRTIQIIFRLQVIFILILAGSCAQQGAPTGGPKDLLPPKVIQADPPNYSRNFDKKKIEIEFDEFLDMANFTQELIVSPPMEEKPIIKLRNKTLIIDFEEDLKEDATYTFNFGEGIADLNERNVLLNYEYVFATGSELDSLSIKGTLRNAFDLSVPDDPMLVMLYDQLYDSIPLQEIPYYVGRTDKEGNFAVNNLRKGVYKLFVLQDGNNNFLFDLPSEQIAFLDTSIYVDSDYFKNFLLSSGMYDSTDLLPDTARIEIDTAGMSPDSIQFILDSLDQQKPDFNSIYVDLRLFTEDPENRYISDYKRDLKENMEIVFSKPVTDSFSYFPVFPDTLTYDDLIPEYGLKRDSLILWSADTNIASLDTIGVSFLYTGLDTLNNYVTKLDTLYFTYKEKTGKKGKKEKEAQGNGIPVKTIQKGGKLDLYKYLKINTEKPIHSLDTSKFELYVAADTIENRLKISPFIDSTNIRRVNIDYDWDAEANYYRMILYPGAIYDLYTGTNDTIDRKFGIKALSDYGKLIFTIEDVQDTVLMQIFVKDRLIREKMIYASGTYEFNYIDPDTYTIKFIHDSNGNGKWDTGKYIEGRQPEKVEYLPREFKLRANWDHTISYKLGTNDKPPVSPEPEENDEEQEKDNQKDENSFNNNRRGLRGNGF